MLVLRLFQWRKGKRMEKFSADYAGKCMTGSIMCVKADDAEVAIAAAREEGAKREREEILDYLTCMAPGVGTARDAARYIKSRGSSEPRCTCGAYVSQLGHTPGSPCYKPEPLCTCWDGTKGCTEHAPDCPCYKPDPKCTCGKGDAPIWLHAYDCPCYKPPVKPLEKVRLQDEYLSSHINALVDAVNELRE